MQEHFPLHFTARVIGCTDLKRAFTRTCRNECTEHEMHEICRSLRKLPYITAAFVADGTITVEVISKHIWDDPAHYPHQRIERLAQFFEDQRLADEQGLTRLPHAVELHPARLAVAA